MGGRPFSGCLTRLLSRHPLLQFVPSGCYSSSGSACQGNYTYCNPSEREDAADRLEFLMYAGDDVHLRLSVYGFEGFILYVAFGS